tara:strand:- start:927 stop:1574 length:648 start_codon:yes stop_codon:yes gene_type:complete
MNRTEKILAVFGLAVLVIGALVIRHQDAGYIAFLERDFETAHAEFSKLAQQGDPWGTYFTGLMHGTNRNGTINRSTAAKYYLAGVRLGNIRSAIRYIDLLRKSKNINQYCTVYAALVDKAVQTHNAYAILLKANQLNSGSCIQNDKIAGAYFFKWAGEIKPQIGTLFTDTYEGFSNAQKMQFKALKIERPPQISNQAFLEYFLAEQDKIRLVKFN